MAQRAALRTSLRQLRNQTPSVTRYTPLQINLKSTQLISTRAILSRPTLTSIRYFHAAQIARIDILPDADKETPKESESHEKAKVTPITDQEYHDLADEFLNKLNEKLEKMAEEKADLDVDFSNGILTITTPTQKQYVINKQPANKQIWLSSPISGPKRYDYAIMGDSMHQKEGASVESWIYIRDGSSLDDVLNRELGITVMEDPFEEIPGSV